MAYEIPGDPVITFPASTGVVGLQFRFVTIDGTGKATLPAAGAAVVGVMQTKPAAAGDAVSVMVSGISKVEAAGSTVSNGDLVAASSIGRVAAPGAGGYTVGRVVGGSSGSTGRLLSVLLQPIGTT